MHLLSQDKLIVNKGAHEQISIVVRGELYIETINTAVNMDISVQYAYLDDIANEILYMSTKVVTEAEQQGLYQAVKSSLPDVNIDFSAWYKQLLFEAFRFEMSSTFNVLPATIDIVA